MTKTFTVQFALLALYFFLITAVGAKPVNIIGKTPDQSISINKIGHGVFDKLLTQYVDENGDVNYSDWKANDIETLTKYLGSLSIADPEIKSGKAATLAFWINAYNALTIYGILEKYPTSSIRNHTAKLFGYNIWKDLKLQVNDKAYSLDDIEHTILRKMAEPRIHFAIVCASHSCPRLLNEAYVADRLDEQLNTNAKIFFANDKNFKIVKSKNTVYLSSILDWFGEDFGENKHDVLSNIELFFSEEYKNIFSQSKMSWKVKYLPYSWKLNDQKTAQKRQD